LRSTEVSFPVLNVFDYIAPREQSEPEDHVEFYTIPGPSGQGYPKKHLVSVQDLHTGKLQQLIADSLDSQSHLYYRCAIRYPNGGWKGTWCLWADIDLDDPKQAAPVVHKINQFSPTPSMTFWSGNRGYHLIWVLDGFETDPKKVQGKLRALVEHLGADPQVGHHTKGLRVPGSINWKAEGAGEDNGSRGLVRLVGPPSLMDALTPLYQTSVPTL
jgi:hypothetical protein